ncbi:MAG: dephospho-CoA kinase [Actinomycetes bacterium]
MTRIGLTGGIGSGKSTVASMLAAKGAVIIDADQISREIVEPGQPALEEIVAVFGAGVLRPDGSLDRGELARLAFADKAMTKRLNAIMHPRISAESASRIASAPPGSVVIYDMPLLVETGQASAVSRVVVVDVPVSIQRERAIARGLEPADVDRRIEVQATREQRLAVASDVIDNSGTLERTQEQVDALWRSLKSEQSGDA